MVGWIIEAIILINTVLAFITVFRQKRDIAATWAWMLVLVFLPVFGFILYSFVGRKLPKKRLFRFQTQNIESVQAVLRKKVPQLTDQTRDESDGITEQAHSLVHMFYNTSGSFLARKNEVKIYTNGNTLFEQIIKDVKAAKSTINIEFYTFYADHIGHQMLDLLVQKAKAGVEIHVIYDSWGSMGTTRKFFKPLTDAGGRAEPFLHTHSAITDFRLNFRDHRKIIVIDGQVGYIGGFNIGDQYLGRKKKFGNWRDTHLRIVGSGVFGLQAQYILDWNVTDVYHPMNSDDDKYFPVAPSVGKTNMQIVSSGPDSDDEQIKMGYIKMIMMARKTCWIQSPYLIPDDSTLDAIRIANMSGVDVRIMVPCMPDHPFVYRATQYYANQLAKDGVKIYFYQKGFIHAKTVVVDSKYASVGSANFDFRSFELNFEINSFIYDRDVSERLEDIYKQDIADSKLQTAADFAAQSRELKFKQIFSRLLSPIL